MVEGLRRMSYTERLKQLHLTTLHNRRLRGDLIETYRLLHHRESVDPQQFLQIDDNKHGLRRHSLKLVKPRPRVELRRNFFSHRIIDSWNSLPEEAVTASTINGFKDRVDRHLLAKIWDYKACGFSTHQPKFQVLSPKIHEFFTSFTCLYRPIGRASVLIHLSTKTTN